MIYLIGSLRNPTIPHIAQQLREKGFEVFDDWFSDGPDADDAWQRYEKVRGRSYEEAVQGVHAKHVFALDSLWLSRADAVLLVCPAGRSGHLELGWALGQGKRGYILLEGNPDRYDIMYQFATLVTSDLQKIIDYEEQHRWER